MTGYNIKFENWKGNPVELKLTDSIASYKSWLGGNHFSFLNLSHDFKTSIDWDFGENGKLWTYNLNYFEYLNQPNMSKEHGLRLIQDYIENQKSLKTAFEPFPSSLRIINWVKFMVKHGIKDAKINDFLFTTSKELTKNLEYHLLGNHLLENGFALYFAAAWFGEPSFLQLAKTILSKELNEQILADGAHFERTPMYHALMLFRLLDCINLAKNNPNFTGSSLLPFLEQKAAKMLGWLEAMTWQNGSMALVNDSANGIAPSSHDLLEYAKELGLPITVTALGESGYRKKTATHYEVLLDVGVIGPDCIPGHAHSDTLAFLMQVENNAFLVDSGISTYEKNERRQWERSTEAHNTVQLADWEQSEIWGGFRVAKRAKPQLVEDTNTIVTAKHDGYNSKGGAHERKWSFGEDYIKIEDAVTAPVGEEAKAYFHFSPNISLNTTDNLTYINTSLWGLRFEGANRIEIREYQCAGDYNRTYPAKKLTVHFNRHLQTIISK